MNDEADRDQLFKEYLSIKRENLTEEENLLVSQYEEWLPQTELVKLRAVLSEQEKELNEELAIDSYENIAPSSTELSEEDLILAIKAKKRALRDWTLYWREMIAKYAPKDEGDQEEQ